MMVCNNPNCTDPTRTHHAKGLCRPCYGKVNGIGRKNPVQKSGTDSGTNPVQIPKKPQGQTPPTYHPNNTHRFFYYCNYKGKIEKGKKLNKKGWYELPYKHFMHLLPLINSRLRLGDTTRHHKKAIARDKLRGPSISIQYTTTNNTMALGIKHFNWPTVEAMETDAYIMAQTIAAELTELTGGLIDIDNLRREKKREIEGHITQKDKNVEKHQEEGIGNFRGELYNTGFFTLSHKKAIQHERAIDATRHKALNEALGFPEAKTPTDTTNMAYDSSEFKRFMGALTNGQYQSNETIANVAQTLSRLAEGQEVYGAGLIQHMAVMEDIRGMAQAITKNLEGGPQHKKHWKGRRTRR